MLIFFYSVDFLSSSIISLSLSRSSWLYLCITKFSMLKSRMNWRSFVWVCWDCLQFSCNCATLQTFVLPLFFIISRSLIYRRLHANLQAYGIIDFPLRYERTYHTTVKRYSASWVSKLMWFFGRCFLPVPLNFSLVWFGLVRYASVWLCFWLNSRKLSFRWNSVARDKIIAVACQCRSPFSEYQMCINVWLLSLAALLSWMETQDFVNVF